MMDSESAKYNGVHPLRACNQQLVFAPYAEIVRMAEALERIATVIENMGPPKTLTEKILETYACLGQKGEGA